MLGEAMRYLQRLQQEGMIDGVGAVGLEPHGGDLYGFLLVKRHSPNCGSGTSSCGDAVAVRDVESSGREADLTAGRLDLPPRRIAPSRLAEVSRL